MKIDRLPPTSSHIYESLHQQIIEMSLAPGTIISKQALAIAFGVSPSPVRDALLRLQSERLVDIVPQSKTSVALIDVQQAREVHFLRLSLEIEVVRVLCKTITEGQIAELKTWDKRLSFEFRADNLTAFRQADTAFHEHLYDFAGVPGVGQIMQDLRGHYDRIRGLYLAMGQHQKGVIREHKHILSAIEARDPVAAELAIRRHLGKSLAVIDDIRVQNPTFFL